MNTHIYHFQNAAGGSKFARQTHPTKQYPALDESLPKGITHKPCKTGLSVPAIKTDKVLNNGELMAEKRICSECGKEMKAGYCINNGMEYFCSDACLHKHYFKG